MALTTNMAAIQDALKNFYLDPIRYQMNEANTPLLAAIEKTSKNIQGDKIVRYLRFGKNGGFGARVEDGTLPTPSNRKGLQITTGTKNLYGSFIITDKVIKATSGNRGSFVNQLQTTIEDLLTDSKDNFDRQIHGDGTGILAKATAAGSSAATIKLAAATNMNVFYEGMRVDVHAVNHGTQKADKKEIVAVDRAGLTITLESNPTSAIADNDEITIQGSWNLEVTGLTAIQTLNNTIYGVNRANNKWFNPTVTAIGGEIDDLKIQAALDEIDIRTGETPDLMIGSYGVRRAYQYLFQSTKRNVNTMEFHGGFKCLDYNGVALTADKYQAAGVLDVLNTKSFTLDRLADWDFIESEGGGILTRLSGQPAFEAALAMYGELICDLPASNARLTGITEH